MENRQGAIPTAPGYWRNPFLGTGADENRQGDSTDKQGAQEASIPAFDFLNTRFEPYPAVKFSELYSGENYDSLYRSARNYLRLLGKELELEWDGHDFHKLFRHFNCALPQHQECELYRNENDIYFHVVDYTCNWELYYIPCAVIDRVEPVLSDILLDFFCLFQHTQGLTPLKQDPVYSMFIGDVRRPDGVEEEHRRLAEEYTKGHIGEVLDKIAQPPKSSIPALKKRILKYDPRPEEAGILALMLRGLELFGKKKKIINCGFFPNETEDYYNCYWPVEICRTLMIVYEEDLLHETIYNWTVDEAQEQSAEVFSGGNKIITPRTRGLVKINQYVTDFMNWLKKFENELHDL